MSKRTESDLVRACLEYLSAKGIMAWRNNQGSFAFESKGRRRYFKAGAPGSGDIFAILPGGRFLSIECKAPKGRISEAQAEWETRVSMAGAAAMVVRGLDTLDLFITDLLREGER